VRPVAASDLEHEAADIRRVVAETIGSEPRQLRFLSTEHGLVAFLTLGMDPARALADAHARASEIEERIRRDHPEISEVIVHTEP
jgi:divalent metal cation (Fe/Co/Zn/Cd) transporter